jgi:adenine-specific DNA-methyltransferase
MSKEKFNKKHTKQAIKNRGEVFTPEHLVEEMLSKLPRDYFTSAEKTMLDNSCGNGNFLVKILEWRIKNGISQLDSLKTIYGIELDENNAKECKERLSLGSKDAEIWKILNHNIICANALDPKHKGWEKVGYMWEGKKPESAFFDFS